LGEVFQVVDQEWHGPGLIAQSRLGLRDEFAAYDAPARAWLSISGHLRILKARFESNDDI
jgi:hydrogenase maturation factor